MEVYIEGYGACYTGFRFYGVYHAPFSFAVVEDADKVFVYWRVRVAILGSEGVFNVHVMLFKIIKKDFFSVAT